MFLFEAIKTDSDVLIQGDETLILNIPQQRNQFNVCLITSNHVTGRMDLPIDTLRNKSETGWLDTQHWLLTFHIFNNSVILFQLNGCWCVLWHINPWELFNAKSCLYIWFMQHTVIFKQSSTGLNSEFSVS